MRFKNQSNTSHNKLYFKKVTRQQKKALPVRVIPITFLFLTKGQNSQRPLKHRDLGYIRVPASWKRLAAWYVCHLTSKKSILNFIPDFGGTRQSPSFIFMSQKKPQLRESGQASPADPLATVWKGCCSARWGEVWGQDRWGRAEYYTGRCAWFTSVYRSTYRYIHFAC